ncbi:DmsC/YnfH family molybdoenzyme membrane anchor subunit [Parahaliea aestuarii]|uniref:4Fe-4S dicluster domain-containing protein n=1 Tax=Parahaliea aestuarii TaxID=1852021 RepID=A0A5C8ZY35_9GAMM|nr:DmsC/YnfH family molybdoenzyme membrane anchor subunit [Parahaliea aestuarii]TXS93475.1 4Fe-4S dicluster domain-containing protein [Parahaliea aestuarii]
MTVKLFEPIASSRPSQSLFPLRDNEPDYALLKDPQSAERNRYGNPIALIDLVDEASSLNINGVSEKGFNPNRNKQHAFHFTADNCIGCHACESACSEKNDLPPHLSFRSVGYVEGGTYPNFVRMNISMACNHCDDPVCLKGCPTRAYTKHPEYGAVIQDPDICFGCGYCTWVCPYNAPQLDPVAGQVEKCNMCVDRLEVGLKPACVSACLGNALNFGVVENTPERREQIDTRIPGFPDPEITKPNIRFQQTRNMPRELTRTDSAPIKYRRDDAAGHYRPAVDKKSGSARFWNLPRLSSRENPLVLFTLAAQAAIGLFAMLFIGSMTGNDVVSSIGVSVVYPAAVALCLGLVAFGLFMSTVHLGKPIRFYRGFNNLRHSPVAREGAGVAGFMAFAGLHMVAVLGQQAWLQDYLPALAQFNGSLAAAAAASGVLAIASSAIGLYYMYRCYRIKARPFWDNRQTAFSFVGCSLYLGGLALAAVGSVALLLEGASIAPLLSLCGVLMGTGLALEGLGLYLHARDMDAANNEGTVSHYVQCTTFGKTYLLRNALLVLCAAGLLLAPLYVAATAGVAFWLVLALAAVVVAVIGRALFYVLVVPTTMPGAFFWKNKGFEQHARDIGLAAMPQVGVVPDLH